MGREVIHEESKHGNCRHMYLCEENECHTLQNIKGSNKIEGLVLDLSAWTKKHTSTKLFERMPNLRLLEVIGAHDIRGDFENSFHELRCIRWHHCPWTCLPSSFRPQKLIFLDMPFNQFKMLWHTSKLLLSLKMIDKSYSNLKIINMSYSKQLKKTPDIRDFAMVEKLCFRGCENLQKLHPSIGQLKYLEDLDIGECSSLKELPETIGQLSKLRQFDLHGCVILKRLPHHIKQLDNLSSLNLANCYNLKRLPEQLGDMKGLKMIDASRTAIEQLPDSIGQLISLTDLNLWFCKRLTSLPDSILKLKLLQKLDVGYCSKLDRLPEQLGEMISLECIQAYDAAIQEIPDSIGRLSRLKSLHFGFSQKLKDVPNSIWNLTSLERLLLPCGDIFTSNLPPDSVKDMKKLEILSLKCSIRLWLPMIQSLTSLEGLSLADEGESLSSVKWFMNLSKLSNLKYLQLDNWGLSYLELPPSLTDLRLYHNATVEQLPDLSNLEHLETLHIKNCIRLKSLPSLPLNLVYLSVDEWTYLKEVPDLSILKKLKRLSIHHCSNPESIDLKQRCLEVKRLPDVLSFSTNMPNKKIPEWLDFKSNGSKICFNIPSSSSVLGVNFVGIALWVVYKFKKPSYGFFGRIDAAITNKTEGIIESYLIDVFVGEVGEEEVQVECQVYCISRHRISIKSGDNIEVAFLISQSGDRIEVLMCGAHIIPKTTSSTSPVSIN